MKTVLDVDFSHGSRRLRHKVVNLKQKFRKRHPWIWISALFVIAMGIFLSVREFTTRAEVTDVFPSTCLGDWQNPAYAEGSPETLASPSSSFAETNSAISNASGTIFCGGFFSSATPLPLGDITNVGLTLVWQVGGVPAQDSTSSATSPRDDEGQASSSNATGSSTVSSAPTSSISTPDPGGAADTSTVSTPAPAMMSAPDDSVASSTGTSFLRRIIPLAFADDAGATDATTTIAPTVPASTSPNENFLDISYSTDGQTWIDIQQVNPENWQDITITLPITDWSDLQNLQIRIASMPTTLDPPPPVYLDGMFLEVHYDYSPLGSTDTSSDKMQNQEASSPLPVVVLPMADEPPMVNQQSDFGANQTPSFDFDLSSLAVSGVTTTATTATTSSTTTASTTVSVPVEPVSTDTASSSPTDVSPMPSSTVSSTAPQAFNIMKGARIFFAALMYQGRLLASAGWHGWLNRADAQDSAAVMPSPTNPVVAQIYDPNGDLTNLQPVTTIVNKELSVNFPPPPTSFHPGLYTMELWIYENNTIYVATETFAWGVIVVNFDKSIYALNDTAHIGFGVLNSGGHTICDASIQAVVTSPSGVVTRFSTAYGSIRASPTCGPQSVTNNPDYTATLPAGEVGTYTVAVTAHIPDGTTHTITDSFAVQNQPPFDVSRVGPTRIFPPAGYRMQITVTPNQDYSGSVIETVPSSFNIVPDDGGVVAVSGETATITWQANLRAGNTSMFSYSFLAPDVSPALYKLGPLQIGSWAEARQWQIAGDFATITLVQGAIKNCTSAATTCGVAFTSNNRVSNMLVVTAVWASSSTGVTATITDKAGDTWNTAVTSTNITDGSGFGIYYAMNAKGGANNVTTTLSSSLKSLMTIQEFSGVATSSALDQKSFATSTTKNATSTAVTTTQAAELLFAFGGNKTNADTGSAGKNFTLINAIGGTSQWTASEYEVVAVSSSYQGVMTINANANWSILFATFKAATAGIPPGVSAVVLNGGSAIVLTPNATTSISVVASTTPGGANLTYATATIYRSGVAGGATCTASNQNCYQIASSSCTFSSASSSINCTAPVWYFAQATDASSSYSGQVWQAALTVTDASGLTTTSSTANGVTLNTLLAVNVAPATMSYGTLNASSTSGSINTTTSISNVGNCSSTLQVSGTALAFGVNSIATSSQTYATSSFNKNNAGSSTALSGSSAAIAGFLLSGPTSTTTVSSTLFWGITIPNGEPTGTYSGTNTFTTIFSN